MVRNRVPFRIVKERLLLTVVNYGHIRVSAKSCQANQGILTDIPESILPRFRKYICRKSLRPKIYRGLFL